MKTTVRLLILIAPALAAFSQPTSASGTSLALPQGKCSSSACDFSYRQ